MVPDAYAGGGTYRAPRAQAYGIGRSRPSYATQLGELHHAAQRGVARAQSASTPGERLSAAVNLARGALAHLGLSMPEVRVVRGTQDAYASGHAIFIGSELARRTRVTTLAQILMHEAGHVHEGHSGIAGGLLQALQQAGLVDRRTYNDLMRDEERVADVYAALGAWLFDPNRHEPAIARWFAHLDARQSDTHPDSLERAFTVTLIVQALDALVHGA